MCLERPLRGWIRTHAEADRTLGGSFTAPTSRPRSGRGSGTLFAPLAGMARLLVGGFCGAMFTLGCVEMRPASLIATTPEPPGARCPLGGLRVDIGRDLDDDGRLDPREVESTDFVCNQRVEGRSVAVRTAEEGPSSACPAGGVRVESGIDDDDDRTLDDDEVDATAHICDGVDGYTSLVRLVAIDPDLGRALCPLGGTRIESGPDLDRDGALGDDEVASFHSVCAVRMNEHLFIVDSAVELPGERCPDGGTRMRFGIDDDGDGALDPEEVDGAPLYLCNEVLLVAGKTSLVATADATAQQCTFGGFVYRFGLDDDYDGVLAQGETDGVRVVCNGDNGYAGLVEQAPFSGGECGPAVHGVRLTSGLDVDRDGVLDTSEVLARETICDGFEGPPGPAALAVQSTDTRYCESEGVAITTGTDWDGDGYLDYDEVESTTEVCDGFDGHNALVEVEDADYECSPSTGVLIRTGTDWNDSGYLDSGEYDEVVICDV